MTGQFITDEFDISIILTARYVFAHSDTGIVGSNPTRRIDCLSTFLPCMSCPTDSLQDPQFKINSDGKQARGPNMKGRRIRRTYLKESCRDLVDELIFSSMD
jgi:hypothetical protein